MVIGCFSLGQLGMLHRNETQRGIVNHELENTNQKREPYSDSQAISQVKNNFASPKPQNNPLIL